MMPILAVSHDPGKWGRGAHQDPSVTHVRLNLEGHRL